MAAFLIDSLSTTPELAAIFADRAVLQALADVEVAVARVQARIGLIPDQAAAAIAQGAAVEAFDTVAMAREARQSGTVVVPFVKALIARVADIDDTAARFVHWGLTSQDVADTAMVLLLAQVRSALAGHQLRLTRALHDLSERHASTVMAGRTLLQPATPITFGLKTALWLDAVSRNEARLAGAFDAALVVQCGGAAGTLAAMGDHGVEVGRLLAAELQVGVPDAPWHAHRDRLAALVAACGITVATFGKIARDVSLLMQAEVGEAAEPGGASSTMPQKANPAGCAIVLAAATRLPGLVASFLTGMVQEHERAVGGWHAEWPTLAATMQTTGAALEALTQVAETLTVHPERMRSNLGDTHGGVVAERLMMHLLPQLGRAAASRAVAEVVDESRRSGRTLAEVLAASSELAPLVAPEIARDLDAPEHYLGAAEVLRRRLVAGTRPPQDD
jgi:3-carboxy-cis,cis-muconate cycloisomerase